MNYYADAFKKYAVFSGRARRKEYWMYLLVNLVIIVVFQILFAITKNASQSIATILAIIYTAYGIVIIVPTLAVIVRRLHDTDRSGWWYFIGMIPIIGSLWLLVLLCLDSTPGDNKYGPNPKGVSAIATPNTTPTA